MVVLRWVLLAASYRQLRHSGQPTARRVKQFAVSLLAALSSVRELAEQIEGLSHQLMAWALQKRHKKVSTHDRLAALDAEYRSLDHAA